MTIQTTFHNQAIYLKTFQFKYDRCEDEKLKPNAKIWFSLFHPTRANFQSQKWWENFSSSDKLFRNIFTAESNIL